MPKVVSLNPGSELRLLVALNIKVAENNRAYFEIDNKRLVYDFDCDQIIGWYDPYNV